MVFGVGPIELAGILLIFLFLFGSRFIPDIGRRIGATVTTLREAPETFRQVNEEADD